MVAAAVALETVVGWGLGCGREQEPAPREFARRLVILGFDGGKGPETFPGAPPNRVPDLQIAFRDGYRTSWRTPLGGIPKAIFEPNTRKWSGDHACSNVTDTPGITLSNRKLSAGDPAIVDLAPTALTFLGVPVSPDMAGKTLLEATL